MFVVFVGSRSVCWVYDLIFDPWICFLNGSKIRPTGSGPQVKSSLVPIARASLFGYPFLTHSHVVFFGEPRFMV